MPTTEKEQATVRAGSDPDYRFTLANERTFLACSAPPSP
jgi:uncharacterized membrane protein YidH (DUF202 family)